MPMNDESPTRGSAFTDDGQLAVWLTFTGGGQGLFVVTVPEPARAVPLIAAAFTLLLGGRRRVAHQ
jgi:hypothetical protein